MTRRDLLKTPVVVAAAGSTACMRSRELSPTPGGPSDGAFELSELTLDELGSGLRSGRWSVRGLVERYIERIEGLDRRGPHLGAVIELSPDARASAESLDREARAGKWRGPLHGMPVLVKDNIETSDRMMTTAGSLALEGNYARQDAPIVKRLRDAGAVILGKTNLSEWANFRSSRAVSGWSGRGLQTRNPYALDRNPSGSSAGSGVAAAACLCAVSVGTETDGSIVSPASINGLVGIKPTVGLLSRTGIIPISRTQDTAGPMARTVRDAALLLSAMAGVDPSDPSTQAAASHTNPDYTRFLDPNGLQGARIGVARKMFTNNPKVTKLVEAALDAMKKAGAEIVDPADLPSHGQIGGAEFEVLCYEFKDGLNTYLGKLGPASRVHSLAEVIAFNEQNSDREMSFFGQEDFEHCQKKGPLTDKTYLDALAKCRKLSRDEGIDAVVAKYKLDAIVAPTSGPAWLIDYVNGDSDVGGCSSAAAVAGYPHITLPAGFVWGLPVGISFFGPAWSEPALLKLAYAFEQITRARRAPRFLPTARLEYLTTARS
jgi:amidase